MFVMTLNNQTYIFILMHYVFHIAHSLLTHVGFSKVRRVDKVRVTYTQINSPVKSNVRLRSVVCNRIVEYLPRNLLKQFLKAFSQSRFNVIWQVNGKLNIDQDVKIPSNVYFVDWVPLNKLFSHPNIQYVIIHGGINTLNEAVHSALPLIGIPLQGDQNSNLKALELLRTAKIVRMINVWDDTLTITLQEFEKNLVTYKKRAEKLKKMVKDHQSHNGDQPEFWIKWGTRHGSVLSMRKYYIRNEYISRCKYFGIQDVIIYSVIVFSLLFMVTK
ncbi:unnamed protein product [Bursaphelenchus xylophilus]|uniref:glucuronosyltransferase n=1 Tax=Bursaphelenchus xylophilus TaxID=6326 RepID=A0A811K4W8_BURXY|nr:unnamed protein product [Bursaphelenchus xylophilus]CAG9086557.1 unnamed protein product [Bursaphelenchus xylophilus]